MLQSFLSVGPLAPGQQITLIHHITDGRGASGRPLVPRQVLPTKSTPIAVLGTPTNLTVTFINTGGGPESADFECVHSHSIQQRRNDTVTCYWRGLSPSSGSTDWVVMPGANKAAEINAAIAAAVTIVAVLLYSSS